MHQDPPLKDSRSAGTTPTLLLKKGHPGNLALIEWVPMASEDVVMDATLLMVVAVAICFVPSKKAIVCPSGAGPRVEVMVAVKVTI